METKYELLHDYYAQYYGQVWDAGTIIELDLNATGYTNRLYPIHTRTIIDKVFVESHPKLFKVQSN